MTVDPTLSESFRPFSSGKSPPIGLIAGSGTFPSAFIRAAKRQGHRVCGLGVLGMAPETLADECDIYHSVPFTKFGRAIRLFKKAGVERVVMAGKFHKTVLFHPLRWVHNIPDWRGVHMWLRYCWENKKDDTLLLAVIREFERDKLKFDSALDYAPELLVKQGQLTRRKPTSSQWRDIRFGWELAKEMGRLDVGQSVCVNETAVLAIEAIEGTDACIRRAGELCRRGGFTVVKVAKPQQDMRFDVPTIGIDTLTTMHEAGARVLAIEADQTIMLDQQEVIAMADRLGITLVAVSAAELELRLAG